MEQHISKNDLFLTKLFQNFHISIHYINVNNITDFPFDKGLRELIFSHPDYPQILSNKFKLVEPNTIYHISDELLCNYICFLHPEYEKDTIVFIGPYRTEEHTTQKLYHIVNTVASNLSFTALENYHLSIPLVSNEVTIMTLISTYGELIWNGLDNFKIEDIDKHIIEIPSLLSAADVSSPAKHISAINYIEERYTIENQMLHAVSRGQAHTAEILLEKMKRLELKTYLSIPPTKIKFYCYNLNSLLRKKAELCGVSLYEIEKISTKYIHQIEFITSFSKAIELEHEIITDYCQLINKTSRVEYPILIQKILAYIDIELTSNLTLKNISEHFHVNHSYLCTLFHQTLGCTITEYIHKKRMEHAIVLLENSSIPIHNIGQICGMEDPNYFSKIFKRYYGKTPSAYRKDNTSSKKSP